LAMVVVTTIESSWWDL